MAEKYWTNPVYLETLQGKDKPETWRDLAKYDHKDGPSISTDKIPTNEWFWFDADEESLSFNVHQSYFHIADAARYGRTFGISPRPAPDQNINPRQMSLPLTDSYFNALSHINDPEWATFILKWSDVFSNLEEDDQGLTHSRAEDVINEIDSTVYAVSRFSFAVPTLTPQLISTFFGSLSLDGALSAPAKVFMQQEAEKSYDPETTSHDNEFVYYARASNVLTAIGKILFGTETRSGVGINTEGRFVSNTAVVMGTGSLEVLPNEVDEDRGYRYSSHNLDSALTRLWAFAGVAALIGDAHRHYDEKARW
jgi:hypothetical protein